MSINRNKNKTYNCVRVEKDKPDTPLEEFEIKALNPSEVKIRLSKRFFLKSGEKWIIVRLKGKELEEQKPWKRIK